MDFYLLLEKLGAVFVVNRLTGCCGWNKPVPLHHLFFVTFHPHLFFFQHDVVEEHYEAVDVDVDEADQEEQHHCDD